MSIKDAEIYFVINRTNQKQSRAFTFRADGKIPGIWDATTGKTFNANDYTQANGASTLPLEFNSFGSPFIVFRKAGSNYVHTLNKQNFLLLNRCKNWLVHGMYHWANRVVHDLSLPLAKRVTKTHESFRFDMLNANTPILESGLLGPVWVGFVPVFSPRG